MHEHMPACGAAGAHSSCSPSSQQATIALDDQQHPEDVSPFAISQKELLTGWAQNTSSMAAPNTLSNSSRLTPTLGIPPAQQQAAVVAGMPAYPGAYPPLFVSQRHDQGQHAINMPATPSKEMADSAHCTCSAGWALFGVGWILPVCWIVGICLPLCSRTRNDKRAAIASAIMLVIYATIIAVLIAASPGGGWYAYATAYSYSGARVASPAP